MCYRRVKYGNVDPPWTSCVYAGRDGALCKNNCKKIECNEILLIRSTALTPWHLNYNRVLNTIRKPVHFVVQVQSERGHVVSLIFIFSYKRDDTHTPTHTHTHTHSHTRTQRWAHEVIVELKTIAQTKTPTRLNLCVNCLQCLAVQ